MSILKQHLKHLHVKNNSIARTYSIASQYMVGTKFSGRGKIRFRKLKEF
jgi:mevalonate kinase